MKLAPLHLPLLLLALLRVLLPLVVAVVLPLADHLLVAVLLVVLVLLAVEDMEDINPDDFYNLDITKDGLALIYRSVCFHLEKWPGGHPDEQVALQQLKDNSFRIILEKTLET